MNLIYTIAIGEKMEEIGEYTIPKMKAYAMRCKAKFICITDKLEYDEAYAVKLEARNLLDSYGRVLFLDCDIVIDEKAPSIFNVVPSDRLGVYMESDDVPERMKQAKYFWDLNEFDNDGCKFAFNAGVMLFSQCHKDIIKPLPRDVTLSKLGRFKEQVWLNYLFRDTEICKLGHEWNHMDLSGKPDDGVYFRHFAAGDRKKLLELIKEQ